MIPYGLQLDTGTNLLIELRSAHWTQLHYVAHLLFQIIYLQNVYIKNQYMEWDKKFLAPSSRYIASSGISLSTSNTNLLSLTFTR